MSDHADPPLLSTRSGRVKRLRKLTRRAVREELGQFLVEGPQAVGEALDEPGRVLEVIARPGAVPELEASARAHGVPWLPADDAALSALADTVTPQGVVAVCATLDTTLEEVTRHPSHLVAVCVDVRDPGNAGTIIRCADAAGAQAVVLLGDSVDRHNAKVARASAGSLFHLPVVQHRDAREGLGALAEAGLRLLAADGHASRDLDQVVDTGELARPTAWVFGNEAHGIDGDTRAGVDQCVRIPIHGRAESLNLATAAAICLYASARAQRPRGPDHLT